MDIIKTIEDTLNISIVKDREKLLYARSCAVLIMLAEGIGRCEIAKQLNVHLTNTYIWEDAGEQFLESNAEFKKHYLDCVAAIAAKEDENA